MSLIINGVDVKTIIYNGVDLQQVNCDGQVVWRKGVARTDYKVLDQSGYINNYILIPGGTETTNWRTWDVTPAWSQWLNISNIRVVLNARRGRWGYNIMKSYLYINGTKITECNCTNDHGWDFGGTISIAMNYTVPTQYYNTSNWELKLFVDLDYKDPNSSGGYGWENAGEYSYAVYMSGTQKP